MNSKQQRAVNKALVALGNYFDDFTGWLKSVETVLEQNGFDVNTDAIYCGESSHADFSITDTETGKVARKALHISWYLMRPGRWELLAYVS